LVGSVNAYSGAPSAKGGQLYYCEIPGVTGVVFELPEGWKYEPMKVKEVKKPHHYVIFEGWGARICMYPNLPYSSAKDWSLSYGTGVEGATREFLKVGNYEVYSLSYTTYSVVRTGGGGYGYGYYDPWGRSSWGFGTDVSDTGKFYTVSTNHDLFFFKEDSRFWLLEGFSRKDAIRIISTFRPAFKVELDSNIGTRIRVGEEQVDSPGTLYLTPFKDYEFEAPEIIPGGPGVRLAFKEWGVGDRAEGKIRITVHISGSLSLKAIYKRQFMLNVSTGHGQVSGSGWYDEGSWAKVSLEETSVGGPLIRHRFSHWAGDASGSDPTISVRMDGPKLVRAVWVEDYTNLHILITFLVLIAGVAFAFYGRQSGVVIQSPLEEGAFMNEIEICEKKLRKLGDLLMQGKISEETYESLRAEYEERIKKLGGDIESQGGKPPSK
jgi:hypothetical protein